MAGVSGFWRVDVVPYNGPEDDDKAEDVEPSCRFDDGDGLSPDDATADTDCSIVFISTSGTCLLSFVVGVVVVAFGAVVVNGDDNAVDVNDVGVAAADAGAGVGVAVCGVALATVP